jgi:hypothetical protein
MGGDRTFAQKAVEIRPFIYIEREPRLGLSVSHSRQQRGRGEQHHDRQRTSPD